MEKSRRRFLKIAGISALGFGTKPVLDVFASPEEEATAEVDVPAEKGAPHVTAEEAHDVEMEPRIMRGPKAKVAPQWAMTIDTRKIESHSDVEPMIEACHKIHNVPKMPKKMHEIKWIWETEFKHAFPNLAGEFMADRVKHLGLPVLCNHCENPPCVRVCPTKATFRNNQGIVMMDYHRCIGCRFCMAACPYGSRSFNFFDPKPHIEEENKKFPTRMRGVVEKCNFCAERLAVGQKPACVEASNGIMAFGNLHDPRSEVREIIDSNYTIRRKSNLGTYPAVYYII